MDNAHRYHRPPFEDVLESWKELLAKRMYSTEIIWILEENLCFEQDPKTPGGVKLGFQTKFTPHPTDSAKVTYHHFAETDAPVVFYRLGENRGRSICIQLCDAWFEGKDEKEGYEPRPNWRMAFYPGPDEEIEEVTDPKRWQGRVVRGRPFTAVDFCMTLDNIRELKVHGRVLSPDERFGLKILRSMHR